MTTVSIKGYRLDKSGKLVRSVKHLSVSKRLQVQSSTRVRVVRKGKSAA